MLCDDVASPAPMCECEWPSPSWPALTLCLVRLITATLSYSGRASAARHACVRGAGRRAAYRFRGGVSGRPLPMPPYAYFFLSAGLRMRNEHIRLSSTAITAPALSNSPQ